MKDNDNAIKARQRMIARMYHKDASKDEDIEWITTKSGQHVPLKDGKAVGGPMKGQDFSSAKSETKSGNNGGTSSNKSSGKAKDYDYDYESDVKAFSEGKIRKGDLAGKRIFVDKNAPAAVTKQYKKLYECARETEEASRAYKNIKSNSSWSDDEKVEQIQAKVDRLSDIMDDCSDTDLQGVYQKLISRGQRIIDRIKSGTLNNNGGGKSSGGNDVVTAKKTSGPKQLIDSHKRALTAIINSPVVKDPSPIYHESVLDNLPEGQVICRYRPHVGYCDYYVKNGDSTWSNERGTEKKTSEQLASESTDSNPYRCMSKQAADDYVRGINYHLHENDYERWMDKLAQGEESEEFTELKESGVKQLRETVDKYFSDNDIDDPFAPKKKKKKK